MTKMGKIRKLVTKGWVCCVSKDLLASSTNTAKNLTVLCKNEWKAFLKPYMKMSTGWIGGSMDRWIEILRIGLRT